MATILDSLVTRLGFETDLSALRRFDGAVKRTRDRLDNLSSQMFGVGRAVGVVGAAATGVFGLAVKQAVQWESDFTGIRKTVNGTEEEFAALDKRLRDMSKNDVPVPVGELAKLAEIGGQLGIGIDILPDFVKVMADIGTSTNLAADEAASGLARFVNNTDATQADFDRVGASIVELGNNFETTEPEILAAALRLAGAGKLIGLTAAEILGTATAMTSLGINAEAGGTAFSRVWADMDAAVQTGSDDLDVFGQITGRAGGEFAGLFKSHPEQAIIAFSNGMGRMIANGENVHAVLEELGFDNVRVRDLILRTAGAGDKLEDAITAGSQAWDENTALAKEASLRYSTMASRFQFAKNRANDLAITVGSILAPIITDMVDRLEPLIKRVSEWIEQHPTAVKWVAALALALAGLGVLLIAIGVAAKALSIVLGGLTLAVATVRGAIWLWRNALLLTRAQLLLLNAQIAISRGLYMASAAATGIATTAQFVWRNALLATRAQLLLLNIATVASKAVQIAAAVATGALTAAQWALNAAMYANPIGLIVLAIVAGIAALIAIGYVIWKFRDQIIGALGMAWNWVKDNWPLLAGMLLVPFTGGLSLLIPLIWKYWDEIVAVFNAIVTFITDIDLFAAGKAFLRSFVDGFLSVKDFLIDAVSGVLDEARDWLPFSDAKKGPLSDLTASGQAIIDTLAAGIRQAGSQPVNQALQVELAGVPAIDVLAPTLPSLTAPTLPALSLPSLDALSAMLDGFLSRLPALPALAAPTMPPLTAPALPPLTAPALPALTTAALPALTTAALPALTTAALPALTTAALPSLSLSLPNLDDLSAMLGGFLDRLPDLTTMTALPVGPVPQPAAAGVDGGGGMTLTLSIGQLNVTATNADPQEIARAIAGDELARQVRALVEQVDSRVRV